METNKGYVVAMYNCTKRIVVISLEMWELIRNTEDYTPLYRTDNAKDAYNYVYELGSNIQKETNKQEFINKAKEWIEQNKHQYKVLSFGSLSTDWDKFIKEFCKAMEEE